MDKVLTKDTNYQELTPERKEELFLCICDDLCKYRAAYEEPDDPELSEKHCSTCPVFDYLV